MFIIGVTLVNGLNTNVDVKMQVGDTAQLAGYTFTLKGIADAPGPNYVGARADLLVERDGKSIATLHPEKRTYTARGMPMTEASLDIGVFRDLYASMGEPIDPQTWIVRLYYKPFISWIWVGCLMMAFGGLLAAIDRRYRRLAERRAPPAPPPSLTVREHESEILVPWHCFSCSQDSGLRPQSQPARGPFTADRQARAGVQPAATAGARHPALARRHEGQVWLLNVWASWCVACRQEHPVLVDFCKAAMWCPSSVSTTRTSPRRPALARRIRQPYVTSIVDADGRVGIDFGVYGVPETFPHRQAGSDPIQADRPGDARRPAERHIAEDSRTAGSGLKCSDALR